MKRSRITTAASVVAMLAVAASAFAGNHGGGGKGGGGGGSRGGHGGSSRGSSHSSSGKSSGGFNQNSRVVQGGGSFQDKGGRVARAEKIDTKVGSPIVGKPVGDAKKGPIDGVKKPPFGDVVTKPPGKLPPDVKPLPPQPLPPKPLPPKPLPPKPFPPKPLPPQNPPHDDHDHHDHDDHHGHHHHGHHDWPIRIVMPAYPCYPPVVREEVVVVEQVVAPAAPAATDAKTADAKAADVKATDAKATDQEADAAKAMDNAQATGKLPVVPAGATLTLEGANLGDKQGQVMLQVGKLSLPATVVKWDGKAATTTLPAMGLTESTTAHVLIYTADAKLANSVAIQLVPAGNTEDDDKDAPKSPNDAKADAKSADAKAGDVKSAETAAGQAQVVSN